jgi:hypothetical protein
MAQFPQHIEDLKVFLDSSNENETFTKRMSDIEAHLAKEKTDSNPPTHKSVSAELTFLVKSKGRITKAVGADRYMDVFCKLVKFLEQNPEKIDKKSKKEGAAGDLAFDLDIRSLFPSNAGQNYTIATSGTTYDYVNMRTISAGAAWRLPMYGCPDVEAPPPPPPPPPVPPIVYYEVGSPNIDHNASNGAVLDDLRQVMQGVTYQPDQLIQGQLLATVPEEPTEEN